MNDELSPLQRNNPHPLPGELDIAAMSALDGPLHPMGNPRLTLHRQFHSNILPESRDIIVYVPPGYEEQPDRRFPVMFLQDGQNLFDGSTSYVHNRTWRVAENADAAICAGRLEPLIIVGVYNTGIHRLGEYTPTANFRLGGGKADLYGHLLADELKPFIDHHYRTLPGPANTGIGGSSLGGLVSLYLGLRRPDVFGRLAVMSPSIWWDHKIILSIVNETGPLADTRVWLDMGTQESRGGLRDSNLLYKLLLKKGWREDDTLRYVRIEGGTHDEAAWSHRIGPAMEFLFPVEHRS